MLEGVPLQPIHGALGSWNILWTPEGLLLMDLDHFYVGPVAMDVQLLSFPWRHVNVPESATRKQRRATQLAMVATRYRALRPLPETHEQLFRPCALLRGILFDAWFSAHWREPGFREHYPDDDIEGEAYWRRSMGAGVGVACHGVGHLRQCPRVRVGRGRTGRRTPRGEVRGQGCGLRCFRNGWASLGHGVESSVRRYRLLRQQGADTADWLTTLKDRTVFWCGQVLGAATPFPPKPRPRLADAAKLLGRLPRFNA